MPTELEPALDIFEVAELFKCSHRTVRRMIVDGELPAVKIGRQWRIRRDTVDQMLTP